MYRLFTYAMFFTAAAISSSVQAELAVFNVNATITDVYDSANVLQGRITIGNPVSGTYQFETQVPDEDPNVEYARYNQANTGAIGFDLITGGVSLKTDPTVPGHMHFIDMGNSFSDFYHIGSWGNRELSDGVKIDDITLDLYDDTGVALNHTLLSATAPTIGAFTYRNIYISGTDANGLNYFTVVAKLDSLMGDGSAGTTNPNLVTLQVEAIIKDVWDPAGALDGQLALGGKLSGTYSYDKSLIDNEPLPDWGRYEHAPNGSGYGFDINGGGLNFKTDSSTVPLMVDLYNGVPSPDNYMVFGMGQNFPLLNGATVDDIGMYINDDTGTMLSSDQIADNPPSITGSGFNDLYISGMHPNGIDTYTVVASITSIKTMELSAISPANGDFIPGQQFDAAVILQPNLAPIMDVNAVLVKDGIFTDLQKCFPVPPNMQGNQILICPGYSQYLTSGYNKVDFTIVLQDGTIINKSAQWRLLE